MVEQLLFFIQNNAPKAAFVGLMAAAGTRSFYESSGFKLRPEEGPGMFRII